MGAVDGSHPRMVIAGAGVAGLETLLALHAYCDAAELTLVAPDGSPFDAELVRIDGRKPEIGDGATAEAHARALAAPRSSLAGSARLPRRLAVTTPR